LTDNRRKKWCGCGSAQFLKVECKWALKAKRGKMQLDFVLFLSLTEWFDQGTLHFFDMSGNMLAYLPGCPKAQLHQHLMDSRY